MRASDFILGVHYHSPFYKNSDGDVYIVSFIGSWLDHLSVFFKEIIYIGHETKEKIANQDYKIINKEKMKFCSIGPPGGLIKLPLKIMRTKKTIREIENLVDGLIVRAPTPRQATIFGKFKGQNRALYLVGEPKQNSFFSGLKERGWKGLAIDLLNLRRKRQTYRIAKECLVISNSHELCRKYKEITGKKTYYCPSSSITERDFYFVEDRCLKTPIKLLFVGRVCRDKGIVELLKAASILKKEKYNIILNIAGESGDADRIDEFMTMAERLKLGDMVSWKGRIPYGEKLFNLYRESDILILPSAHEGFPRVITEALANGVLVIATQVGGIGYVCENKREVFFIKKTPESIVSGVKEILSDKNLRMKMIKNGYEFSKSRIAGENEKLMASILEEEWS